MQPDPVFLSRLQFAFTIGFHILWPAYTIGLSGFVVVLNTLWLRTHRPVYRELLRFWIRLFALGFAMGVVSGLVMSYQIGTNWSVFAQRTSNVIGPFFTYEVLTAFFLEAGFIGILLFGMQRVGQRVHYFASVMVALGAVFSAFWILAANSWMQTPAGYRLENGTFYVADWWAAVFSPSLPYRFAHMLLAGYVTGTFVVIGVMGWHVWRDPRSEFARTGFSLALLLAAVLVPAQMLAGHEHGLNTREYQPVKLAAIEAQWETERRVPLRLFAWPDLVHQRNDWTVDVVPGLGSWIETGRVNGEVQGLKSVGPEEWPFVPIVFWAFRLMVGCGLVMLSLASLALWLRWRKSLYETRWFSLACMLATPLGFIATLAGWTVTEVGRQPWAVYGQLRTADAVAPITLGEVSGSFLLFAAVYAVLLVAFFYYGVRTVRRGAGAADAASEPLAVRPGTDSAAGREATRT
jgi:cytochrome bd ubiquinol oxidase subunit I